MATTVYTFAPPANGTFQFQPTLDGSAYTCIVFWNTYAQRWYLAIYQLQGVRVATIAMVASPAGYSISLTAGYFTTQIIWRQVDGMLEVVG